MGGEGCGVVWDFRIIIVWWYGVLVLGSPKCMCVLGDVHAGMHNALALSVSTLTTGNHWSHRQALGGISEFFFFYIFYFFFWFT